MKFAFCLLLLLFLAVLDIALGSVNIPFSTIWESIVAPDMKLSSHLIVHKIRLPRAGTAILAGMGLSVSGLLLQALFRNPLAGPSVLGITSGSAMGVALVVLALGQGSAMKLGTQMGIGGQWIMIAAAALGAFLVLLLVLLASAHIPDGASLLVVGMMVGNFSMALVGLWQYFSAPEQVKEFLYWSFGSLEGVLQEQLLALSLAVMGGLALSSFLGKPLNLLVLGEDYARSMGLQVGKSRTLIILCTSLLAGSITAFCGPIAFIGLAVPHLARLLFRTADHRLLLPASMLLGAALLLACDLFAHLPGTSLALPINAATSLVGAPVVIAVLLRKRV